MVHKCLVARDEEFKKLILQESHDSPLSIHPESTKCIKISEKGLDGPA
jgi:hypothetical protein